MENGRYCFDYNHSSQMKLFSLSGAWQALYCSREKALLERKVLDRTLLFT